MNAGSSSPANLPPPAVWSHAGFTNLLKADKHHNHFISFIL